MPTSMVLIDYKSKNQEIHITLNFVQPFWELLILSDWCLIKQRIWRFLIALYFSKIYTWFPL